MLSIILLALIGFAGTPRGAAQAVPATAVRLEFEVTSVKLGDPRNSGGVGVRPDGKFRATDVTLRQLLRYAYDVRDFQISGGPDWIESVKFTIEAKPASTFVLAPGADGLSVRLMVQSLLADRFKLAVHRVTRQEPVFELVVDKTHKLKESVQTTGQLGFDRGQLVSIGAPLSLFVRQLSQQLGRSVLDKTGLTGKYDFTLNWAPDFDSPGGAAPDSRGPSIFAAIQDDLGLKLVSTRGPVELVVIDHVEKPNPN